MGVCRASAAIISVDEEVCSAVKYDHERPIISRAAGTRRIDLVTMNLTASLRGVSIYVSGPVAVFTLNLQVDKCVHGWPPCSGSQRTTVPRLTNTNRSLSPGFHQPLCGLGASKTSTSYLPAMRLAL